MSELHLGRMTYEELSIWFGLKPKTFATAKASNRKNSKYLKHLLIIILKAKL